MAESYGDSLRMGFGFDRNVSPVVAVVARVARRLFPVKTARQLASRAGANHRTAEGWLAEANGMNAEQLATMLRSDIGLKVLEEMIGEMSSPPSWWPAFKVSADLNAIEREQAALTSRIEALRRGR